MWPISLDLKDAYLHVPIHPSHRQFLRFTLRDSVKVLCSYQWGVLLFGLAMAIKLFSRLVAPVMVTLSMFLHIEDCHKFVKSAVG